MAQSQSFNRPNSIYALVYGTLTFTVSKYGLSRNVAYSLEIDVNCAIPPGSRQGSATVTSIVDGPVADDPGFLESIIDFLLMPAQISQQITNAIQSRYGVTSTPLPSEGPCSSIGANAFPTDSYKYDDFVWDVPPPKHQGSVAVGGTAANKPTATVYFDRIVRNPTIESNPLTGPLSFMIYINGAPAHIPRNSTASLTPGSSFDQQYCKTIDMEDANALQVLFTDSLGGAVWSQFTSGQNFGAGGSRKMTTGRNYLTPPLHPHDKPVVNVLREFELDYHIVYQAPTLVAPSNGVGPTAPTSGTFTTGQPQPDQSCIRI
jgi:hypothetical protein